jgi:hypothetical protein
MTSKTVGTERRMAARVWTWMLRRKSGIAAEYWSAWIGDGSMNGSGFHIAVSGV